MNNEQKYPYYLALFAFVVFIIGMIAAYLTYSNYSAQTEYTSDLVRGPHPYIFKTTTILTGFLLLPFYPSVFQYSQIESNMIPKLGRIAGVASVISLILVGIIDVNTHYRAHEVVAGGFFMGTAISLFLWLLMIINTRYNVNFQQITKNSILFLSNIVFLCFMISMIVYFVFFAGSDGPVIQKVIIFGLIGYLTYYAIRMVE